MAQALPVKYFGANLLISSYKTMGYRRYMNILGRVLHCLLGQDWFAPATCTFRRFRETVARIFYREVKEVCFYFQAVKDLILRPLHGKKDKFVKQGISLTLETPPVDALWLRVYLAA